MSGSDAVHRGSDARGKPLQTEPKQNTHTHIYTSAVCVSVEVLILTSHGSLESFLDER